MDYETVEYKIKEEGKRWEDTPVFMTDCMSPKDPWSINKYADFLARCHNAEVRWNFRGSSQGHYIGYGYIVS